VRIAMIVIVNSGQRAVLAYRSNRHVVCAVWTWDLWLLTQKATEVGQQF
jgi:hypothetical protein